MTTLKTTGELIEADLEHLIHPMTSFKRLTGVVFEEGQGIILKDTEGKEYIDFMSGVVNVNAGYGRREIAEAVMAQLVKLSYASSFGGFSNRVTIECAERLAEMVPKGLGHFFFCSGGSEAIDSAFKIARLYWRAKGQRKYKIISLHNSYHGVSLGVLGATGLMRGELARNYEPLAPGFVHIPCYHCYRCSFGLEYPQCDTRCARFLEETIVNEGEDTVAAFIAEPVLGSGGMIPPPPTYWPLVRRVCTEHKVLLIDDEVMTGFGRTGKLFAIEHWGVRPDLMTVAKGITSAYLPFAAVAVSDEVFEGMASGPYPFRHSYTYSGHPACCAAALATMEIYRREKLVENAARVGKHLSQRLQEFLEFEHVGDIGGLGLMWGLELVADKATKARFDPAKQVNRRLLRRARGEGILLQEMGDRIGLAPPLIVTTEQVDRVMKVLKPLVATLEVD